MDKGNVVVVGGSGGIGSEIVRVLSATGVPVSFTYHRNHDVVRDLQNLPGAPVGYSVNLLSEKSIKDGFERILKERNPLDAVVYSVTPPIANKNLLATEWQEHAEHLDLQTKGLFYVVQALKERILMRKRLKFVVIGTEYCVGRPPAGLSPYVQAKYALLGFAKSMLVDLAKYQCTVNMISPGMVETPLIANLPPKLIEMTADANPLKRIATPKDVAHAAAFLLEDASDYLNGVHLLVNGGSTLL